MSRVRTVAEGWVPTRHGIPSSYNRGCRCDLCKAANTARHRTASADWFARRVEVDGRMVATWVPADRHGLETTYVNLGCRCEPCTAAGVQHNARNRERRAGAA